MGGKIATSCQLSSLSRSWVWKVGKRGEELAFIPLPWCSASVPSCPCLLPSHSGWSSDIQSHLHLLHPQSHHHPIPSYSFFISVPFSSSSLPLWGRAWVELCPRAWNQHLWPEIEKVCFLYIVNIKVSMNFLSHPSTSSFSEIFFGVRVLPCLHIFRSLIILSSTPTCVVSDLIFLNSKAYHLMAAWCGIPVHFPRRVHHKAPGKVGQLRVLVNAQTEDISTPLKSLTFIWATSGFLGIWARGDRTVRSHEYMPPSRTWLGCRVKTEARQAKYYLRLL